MATSHITIHHEAIGSSFGASPLGGTSVGKTHGFTGGRAEAIAAQMALAARINASTFEQRTGRLVASVIPIVRHGKGGSTEVGVGTTVEHGAWLEIGTHFHFIRPVNTKFLQANPGDPIRGPVPDKWELEGKHTLLPHPGNRAYHWMSDAVRAVLPGARVRVWVKPELKAKHGH